MEDTLKKALLLYGLLTTLAIPSGLWAQQTGYFQTNLVSNVSGVATTTDAHLVNPWGISFIGGDDFWIANNNNGTSTLYNAQGTANALVVTIPVAAHNPNGNCTVGCPTGTVANTSNADFGGAPFIFDTEDGLIVKWNAGTEATVAFDNSASGAVYKGLATTGTHLLAANFNSGKIDVYDSNFLPANLPGGFNNPNLPAGLAPHGIRVIGSQVFVAYAQQDAGKHDAQPGAGLGQVDIFDLNGNLLHNFVAPGGHLNAPWGLVEAPGTFGAFANAILVGNFGDGTINAYDTTGHFLGQFADSSNTVIVNPGLWDLVFGAGGTGDPNTLFLTAGGTANQPNFPAGGSATSVFASITPAAAGQGPAFSLNFSAQSATVARGGSTNITVGAAAAGGFNGAIQLSCVAPAGITCSFNPTTISPGSNTLTSTLTISAAATPPPMGYSGLGMALLPGLGLFGTVFTAGRRRVLTRKSIASMSALCLVLVMSLFALGCGNNSKSQTNPGATSVMVTGRSGALSRSANVTVTVN